MAQADGGYWEDGRRKGADHFQKEKLEYLSEEAVFRRNAFILITTMIDLSNQTPQDTSVLVDEVLHSLFFLGVINSPPFSPRSLLDDDDEILDYLKIEYPLPFQLYLTQLPRRSPFSCLLDMVASLYGQENEDQIKDKLKIILHQMKEGTNFQILFSSTSVGLAERPPPLSASTSLNELYYSLHGHSLRDGMASATLGVVPSPLKVPLRPCSVPRAGHSRMDSRRYRTLLNTRRS
ncbi:hypothetical protein FQA47_002699 [Oryzias melastigma]|uniref:Uncharacterized protein n=1 Tax=Oryzias melastigma TaxID=30732 RepID=A0A834BZG0_ORYME|nr:hypothetical protein FQA47_002699 [Oryzias melastigma]